MLILRYSALLCEEALRGYRTQTKSQSLPEPKIEKIETSVLTAPKGKSIMHCRRPLVNLKKPTKRCRRTPREHEEEGNPEGKSCLRCEVLNDGEMD